VVFSFLQPYRKTARNLNAAASLHGFDWRDPPLDEKRALLADLAAIALNAGMTPTLCTQPHLLDVPDVSAARCIDMRRLSDIAGQPVPDGIRATVPAVTALKAVTSAITTPAPRAAPIATR